MLFLELQTSLCYVFLAVLVTTSHGQNQAKKSDRDVTFNINDRFRGAVPGDQGLTHSWPRRGTAVPRRTNHHLILYYTEPLARNKMLTIEIHNAELLYRRYYSNPGYAQGKSDPNGRCDLCCGCLLFRIPSASRPRPTALTTEYLPVLFYKGAVQQIPRAARSRTLHSLKLALIQICRPTRLVDGCTDIIHPVHPDQHPGILSKTVMVAGVDWILGGRGNVMNAHWSNY